MKIIIELDHAVDEFEAEEMVEEWSVQPWARKVYIDRGCGGCKSICDNKKQ